MVDPIFSRDEAFEKIQGLRNKYGDSAHKLHESNEAETRLLIIDEILQAIGWNKDDFHPEYSANGEYIDYLLTVDNIPRLIVEAKRIGRTFAAPSNQMHELCYSLTYFQRAYGRALQSIIHQVTQYARSTGVPYAVLTNGAEWFLIQVIPTAGQKEKDLKGYYFGNLLSNNSNFDLLWELISKPSVAEGNLDERLHSINEYKAKQSIKVSSHLQEIEWKHNSDGSDIKEFYQLFFSDLIDSRKRKMLEQCFTEDSQLRQYQRDLSQALKDTPPSFLPANQTKDSSPGEGKNFLLQETGDTSGRVILVVGSVGCGKSTLVEKVIVESKIQKTGNLRILKLDLINEVRKAQGDIFPILWKYLVEEWRKNEPNSYKLPNLRTYFYRELLELKEGESSELFATNRDEYVRAEAQRLKELKLDHITFFTRCWRYYRSEGYGITLVIDNIDRASEDFQEQVYGFSHELANRTGATVIVTMREFTFFRAKDEGFLDVRQEDSILHLKSPNLEQLLSKRIKYIENYLDQDFRTKIWRQDGSLESIINNSKKHSKTLKETFLENEDGRKILAILSSVSWHNVRYFLDTLKRIHVQIGDKRNSWKEIEVVAALMTSNSSDGSSPIIPNIYKPPYPNYQCYFLKVRVLAFLLYGIKGREQNRGVKLARIVGFLRLYGYQSNWISRGVEELVRDRLMECLEAPLESDYTKNYELRQKHSFRASPLAVILFNQILDKPIYLSLVGYDIPFYDSVIFKLYQKEFESIASVLDERQLEEAAIGLLLETNLANLVAVYLHQMLKIEQISNKSLLSSPEIESVEQKISDLESALCKYEILTNLNVEQQKTLLQANIPSSQIEDESHIQRSLFDDEYNIEENRNSREMEKVESDAECLVSREVADKVPVPRNILSVKISSSEQAPLIFWSLVALRAAGHKYSSGVEITKVINSYLVGDHQKRFPNNISRALRQPALISQPWLDIAHKYEGNRNFFGLADNWFTHWQQNFQEEAPKI